MPRKIYLSIFCWIFFFQSINAQTQGICWGMKFVPANQVSDSVPDSYDFNKKGFYLRPNTAYRFETTTGLEIYGRLLAVEKDTLVFSNAFSPSIASLGKMTFDTLKLHPLQITRLFLLADRSMGYFQKVNMNQFRSVFIQDSISCPEPTERLQIYSNDSQTYEVVLSMSAQGLEPVYEDNGRIFIFQGTGIKKPDLGEKDDTYDVRNIIWLTPCKVEKINGLSLGAYTENTKNNRFYEPDSLMVNGLAIEVNPFFFIQLSSAQWKGIYADSIAFYNEILKSQIENRINGLSISSLHINESKINGLHVCLLLTVVDEMNGVAISGLNNFAYKFNGLSCSFLINRATQMKGVQIGLFNKATSLRGFQFGLWNVNGKRSLPFVNWQFSD